MPVVLLVLEGGKGTLRTVMEAVQHHTPTVIVQGSGRAADLLADVFRKTRPKSKQE